MTGEERLGALEAAMQQVIANNTELQHRAEELHRQNQELHQALERSQRRPIQEGVVDARLMGKPKCFDGKEENWPRWEEEIEDYTGRGL